MGVAVWPMVELEADDALASAAQLAAADDARREGLHLDAGQGSRPVRARRSRGAGRPPSGKTIRNAAGVREKFGVEPALHPRLPRAGRRLGRRLPGHPEDRQGQRRAAAEPLRADRGLPARRAQPPRIASWPCCSRTWPRCAPTPTLFGDGRRAALAPAPTPELDAWAAGLGDDRLLDRGLAAPRISRSARAMRTYVRAAEATILHADLDAFYASVEQRDDPRLRGRPVIVGGGRRAGGELRGQGVRRPHGDGRRAGAPAVPAGDRRAAADVGLLARRARRSIAVFDDTTPLVEGLSIDEAFLDVRGLRADRGHARRDRGAAAPRRCSSGSACRSRSGVARTKFLAKVASGVAKPDGLLVVPPERRARVPAPAAGRAAVGRRPGDRATSCTTRGITTVGEVARLAEAALVVDPRPRRRAGTCTRSPTTAIRGRCRRGAGARSIGVAARARPRGRRRRTTSTPSLDRPRRPRHPPDARRRAGRPHRRAAPALRRLLARDPLAHAAAARPPRPQPILATARGLLAAARADDRAPGAHAVGVAVGNLDDDDAVQLTLPFDRHADGRARRRARRGPRPIRHRARSPAPCCSAATRASMPLLPD